jgi:serine/threonine protein kinase/DNA-binding NarL/FixJ family response regulator
MEPTRAEQGVSPVELLAALKESGLFSDQEIERAVNAAADAALDGRSLAQWLLTAGMLTPYQVEAVCSHRFAELRIGNYEVLDRLGAGGMGTVFKARHRRMKRVVALKVLLHSLAQDASFVQRFQREVETIARLSHPNVVMAFDADEAEAGHFLVMEYVDGQDLASLVQKQGPLGADDAVHCLLQAARGLEYAHAQGIIHRDIKPGNLLRDAAGTVKVTDLGLARLSSRAGSAGPAAGSGITQAGGILGTVDYMAPEQAVDSTSVDHRADVYSLGATLYFLLAGRPMYQGPTLMAALLKHREAPIPSLTAARPDVPAALDAVFGRMVAKAPADRYQSMTEVAAALQAVAATPGQAAAAPPVDTSATGVWQAPPASPTAAPREAAQTLDVKPASTSHGPALKVVLVEPSRTQSAIIRKYLQAQRVGDVVAVATGQEAMQAVRTARPDVVITALHLADMTGVELAQQVRAQSQAAAPGFVLISSETESAEAGTLSKCGKAVLLQKPFTPEQLGEALRVVSAGTPPAAPPAPRGRLRVLIVDDSAPARLHERRVLEGLGLSQFVEAEDGAAAVAAVARESFDLIVTDYNMPFMDGRGLVAYLKRSPATAAVPILMVTTEQDPGKLEAVRQLGVAAVCDKSFPPEAVAKVLDQLGRAP